MNSVSEVDRSDGQNDVLIPQMSKLAQQPQKDEAVSKQNDSRLIRRESIRPSSMTPSSLTDGRHEALTVDVLTTKSIMVEMPKSKYCEDWADVCVQDADGGNDGGVCSGSHDDQFGRLVAHMHFP